MPIVMNLEGMVEEAKKNPCTVIGKEICASHVAKVWEAISAYVIHTLCNGRGVKIPGLATITFKIKTIELSAREVMVQKVPHIILASEIAKRHALIVPEVDINLSYIAQVTKLSRDHVEQIVNEVISAFNRAIMCDPQVEFWFTKIGRVVIQCAEVDVVFCSEFLNLLGYGEEFVQDKACPLR